jgi:GDP-4-dehydro-6-deoxy-D-mannose reductase
VDGPSPGTRAPTGIVGARVAVTGAQGLLGRHATGALLQAGADAVLGLGRSARLDDRYTHDLEWLGSRTAAPLPETLRWAAADPRYDYVALDLRNVDSVADVAQTFRPDIVIHAAAALRDASWDDLLASNIGATLGLVQGLAAAGRPSRLVLVSSGLVYGAGRGRVPFAEDGPTEPLDPYGATKRASEDIGRIASVETGLRAVVARVFNLVGPGLQDRHLPAVLAARINAIARRLAPPELHLGPLQSTRDFIDVRDAAAALLLLAEVPEPPPVVNVASGTETPVRSVLDLLLELAGTPDVRAHFAEGRGDDVPRSFADVRPLTSLGFSLKHELRDTLGEMLTYFDAFPGR